MQCDDDVLELRAQAVERIYNDINIYVFIY